jgi:uncharacterized protein (TIGR02466 family)
MNSRELDRGMNHDEKPRNGEMRPGAAQSVGDLIVALNQAQKLHQAGQREEAEALYRKVLAAQPDDPPANHYLGLLLIELGRKEEGDPRLDRSIELSPRDPVFHNNRGHVLIMRGEAVASEAACRRAIALKPDLPQAHLNLGLALKAQGRKEEALMELCLAAAQQPSSPEAHFQVGLLLYEKGNSVEEALQAFDRAIAARPAFFDAHYYRGDALMALGRHPDAIQAFRRAVHLRDTDRAAYALGNAFSAAGRNEEARAAFWHAVELKPENPSPHYAYTQLTWAMGLKGPHLASYAFARERLGDQPELLLSEGAILTAMGDLRRAADLLGRARSLAPDRADIAGELGRALSLLARHEEAYEAYNQAIKLSPNSSALHQSYGSALLRGSQAQRAIYVLDEAHRINPNDQLALGTLTAALREAGDSRYHELVDVEKYVRMYEVPLPTGFADAQTFNHALAEELDRFHTRKIEAFDQTLRGGTQTMGQLFQQDSRLISLARESLAECVAQYIRDLPDDPLHPTACRKANGFEFSGSWSCRLPASGFHISHIHPKAWISSAYYVQVPSTVEDDIGHEGWLAIGRSEYELNAADMAETFIKPVVGRLVLFPSFYWHGTVPFSGEGNRVTISFDALPK